MEKKSDAEDNQVVKTDKLPIFQIRKKDINAKSHPIHSGESSYWESGKKLAEIDEKLRRPKSIYKRTWKQKKVQNLENSEHDASKHLPEQKPDPRTNYLAVQPTVGEMGFIFRRCHNQNSHRISKPIL